MDKKKVQRVHSFKLISLFRRITSVLITHILTIHRQLIDPIPEPPAATDLPSTQVLSASRSALSTTHLRTTTAATTPAIPAAATVQLTVPAQLQGHSVANTRSVSRVPAQQVQPQRDRVQVRSSATTCRNHQWQSHCLLRLPEGKTSSKSNKKL